MCLYHYKCANSGLGTIRNWSSKNGVFGVIQVTEIIERAVINKENYSTRRKMNTNPDQMKTSIC